MLSSKMAFYSLLWVISSQMNQAWGSQWTAQKMSERFLVKAQWLPGVLPVTTVYTARQHWTDGVRKQSLAQLVVSDFPVPRLPGVTVKPSVTSTDNSDNRKETQTLQVLLVSLPLPWWNNIINSQEERFISASVFRGCHLPSLGFGPVAAQNTVVELCGEQGF